MSTAGASWLKRGLRHLVLATTSLFILLPYVWMLSVSLKPPAEVFEPSLKLWPSTFYGVENYTAALVQAPIARYMLNGLIVCGAIFVSQVLIALPCAYALAKLRFRGRDTIFALVLIGILIPHQVLAIPLFVMFHFAGILDTYAGLVVPSVISVFGIFLMRQFFRTIPDDIIHAARLDGFSENAIVWRIMVPNALPAIAAFGVFSVTAHWNDLFWPLIVVQTGDIATPALGTLLFRDEEAGMAYGPLMAGAVVMVLPLLLLFLAAQKRFVDGISFAGFR